MVKILVIEDDVKVRKGLNLVLEHNGYEVFLAENGYEGIKLAKEILPNLIICDIMMPAMDGYTVLRHLSEQNETSIIPFLFLTAKVEIKDIRAGLDLGADDYLLKPIKETELLKAIKVRLEKFEKIKILAEESHVEKENIHELTAASTIMLTIKNNPRLVPIKNIICIEADNQYSKVSLSQNDTVLVKKSLAKWESVLPKDVFIRIHRSTIVNIRQITELTKWSSNTMKVYLDGTDKTFFISQRYLKKVRSILNSL